MTSLVRFTSVSPEVDLSNKHIPKLLLKRPLQTTICCKFTQILEHSSCQGQLLTKILHLPLFANKCYPTGNTNLILDNYSFSKTFTSVTENFFDSESHERCCWKTSQKGQLAQSFCCSPVLRHQLQKPFDHYRARLPFIQRLKTLQREVA